MSDMLVRIAEIRSENRHGVDVSRKDIEWLCDRLDELHRVILGASVWESPVHPMVRIGKARWNAIRKAAGEAVDPLEPIITGGDDWSTYTDPNDARDRGLRRTRNARTKMRERLP